MNPRKFRLVITEIPLPCKVEKFGLFNLCCNTRSCPKICNVSPMHNWPNDVKIDIICSWPIHKIKQLNKADDIESFHFY